MRTVRILAALGIVAMVATVAYAAFTGDVGEAWRGFVGLPWLWPPLMDLTVGLALFSAWVVYRDGWSVTTGAWVAGILLLGFAVGCAYLLLAERASKGDPLRFFLGRRRPVPVNRGKSARR